MNSVNKPGFFGKLMMNLVHFYTPADNLYY